ncbi:hypothetical protein niasHT_019922 [Heterodera trifolii]|uniref:Ankyrin repeat and sterile alpha motif domain-containing protein 1B n=1 Tax=Heterodera trifolii TaxID=157864 RepID=A0ABD2L8K0_9BILA
MGRQCAQNINELFEDCRRGQTHSVQLWIAQKSKKHRSPLNFLRSGNASAGAGAVGWLADLREPSTSHTLLHLAALHGHRELTRVLMQRDVQLATARDRKGCLPLHLAAWNGHEEVIATLLAAEPASVNAVNNARESALHLATLNGHANAARLLLRHHADARLRNARMETALDIAVRTDKANLCRLLMLNCPELNLMCASDCCSSTLTTTSASKSHSPPYPLHSAARLGHTDCMEALLEHGFDLNYLGPEGTALHVAVRQGQCAALRILLDYGVGLDICDSNGQTVSDWLSTRLSGSTHESDDGMDQRLRESKKLVDEAVKERRRAPQPAAEHRHGQLLQMPEGIWKSAVPEPKFKQFNGTNNGTLKTGRIPVPPPPVASPRSLSQTSTDSRNNISSPLRGAFSPSSCTYQPLPNEIGMEKMPSSNSQMAPPYQNVPKPTLTYDNAPIVTDRQRKWVHNCANGCMLPENIYSCENATVTPDKHWRQRNAELCSPCAELGLIRLPTVEDFSACSTLERSPKSARGAYGGTFPPDTVPSPDSAAGGAPLAPHEEPLSASVTPLPPTEPERSNNDGTSAKKTFSKQFSTEGGNGIISLEMPSCSSSIATLAPHSSPSSCSLHMLSNLSPSSSATSHERGPTYGETSLHCCASPNGDQQQKSTGSPTTTSPHPQNQQKRRAMAMDLATTPNSTNNGAGGAAQVSRVRQLVQWVEKSNKEAATAAFVDPVDDGGGQLLSATTAPMGSETMANGGKAAAEMGAEQKHRHGTEKEEANGSSSSSSTMPVAQNGGIFATPLLPHEVQAVHQQHHQRQQSSSEEAESVHQRKQSTADHEEQWKEIDELLHSLQHDSQLIAHANELNQNPSSLMKNSSKNSISSFNSSSSPNSCAGANGTACAYQPIVRWLRIQVGLSREHRHHQQQQQQQQLNNNGCSAQALAELLHRHGFDTVRFMKGSLNTALMDEIGVPRRVQLQICRFLNDNTVPEHIRSAEQFEFVSDWLDSLDLLDHLGSFALANLTSTTDVIAAKLSRGDLEKMNVTQLGHIARIMRSLDLAVQQRKKLHKSRTNSNSSGSSSPNISVNGSSREACSAAPFMSSLNQNGQQNLRQNIFGISPQSPIMNIAELRVRLKEDSARFSAHYLGSTEISNVEGTEDCRRAMHAAKNRVRQMADVPWVVLEISVAGINIRENDNKVFYRHPIANIQVVCQDEVDLNCFAYIYQEGDRHFCYVFCVLTAIIAKEIIVTLGETFNLAYKIAIQQ